MLPPFRYLFFRLLLVSVIIWSSGCTPEQNYSSLDPINWQQRTVTLPTTDSLVTGRTYLSVYSEIYSLTAEQQQSLTATISMRNTSDRDSIYIESTRYYNTAGALIRTYFDQPIFLAPL